MIQPGVVSNSAARPVKRKKKKKKPRFSSLRGGSTSDLEDDCTTIYKRLDGPMRASPSDMTTRRKIHSGWDMVKDAATKLSHPESGSLRVSGNVTITRHQSGTITDSDSVERSQFNNAAFTNESFPFPDLPGDFLPTSEGRNDSSGSRIEDISKGGLLNTISLPSRKIGGILQPTKTLKTIALPGYGTSRRKAKNLVHYVTKKTPEISELDRGKISPLLQASKSPLILKFSSTDCKLVKADFLFEFQDNIEEISFEDNKLSEFPDISHLKSLKRLYLGGNQLTTFSLQGMDSLHLLSLQENKISVIPTLETCDSLVHLDLRGNPLFGGYENIAALKNIEFLDLGQCLIDVDIEDFDNLILAHLKALPKLHFLAVGDNPVLRQFPELKYWIIHALSPLLYYDYIEITPELRNMAAEVKKYGMDATKQSWKKQKEEIRLQRTNSMRESKDLQSVPAPIQLPTEALLRLFSYFDNRALKELSLVSQIWYSVACDVFERRNSKIFDRFSVLTGSTFYKLQYQSLVDSIQHNSTFLPADCNVMPIEHFVEFSDGLKMIVILVNKGKGKGNGYWHVLYDQLSYRYCEKSNKPFQYLNFAIYETQSGSMADGIDSLLRASGATRIHQIGRASHSFDNWLSSVADEIPSRYSTLIQQNRIPSAE